MKKVTMDLGIKQLRLLKMIEVSNDHAILLLDETGHVETWNNGAERIKGYKADEIIGQDFSVFYTEEDRKAGLPQAILAEARSAGSVYNETWRVRKDGTAFWGSVTVMAMYNDKGDVIGFGKITRDLTERRLMETSIRRHAEELELKNKEIEQFVYIASHDLQEPLLTVSNFVELFQAEYAGRLDDNAVLYLNFMLTATERMKSLIKSLLDYSRLGTIKKLEEIDCNKLVKDVLDDLSVTIGKAGAQISFDKLPVVSAYLTELRQLFQNLISNAVKFRRKNMLPKIAISATRETDCWRFSVSDNGIGIDPKFKEKVFLIFQRLHGRDEFEGNGIGLAYCKKIVDLHGGQITFENNSGAGSTFIFTLPFKTPTR
nr:ATP-binding protein [uncultured Mucilaginibacter sp.]